MRLKIKAQINQILFDLPIDSQIKSILNILRSMRGACGQEPSNILIKPYPPTEFQEKKCSKFNTIESI